MDERLHELAEAQRLEVQRKLQLPRVNAVGGAAVAPLRLERHERCDGALAVGDLGLGSGVRGRGRGRVRVRVRGRVRVRARVRVTTSETSASSLTEWTLAM